VFGHLSHAGYDRSSCSIRAPRSLCSAQHTCSHIKRQPRQATRVSKHVFQNTCFRTRVLKHVFQNTCSKTRVWASQPCRLRQKQLQHPRATIPLFSTTNMLAHKTTTTPSNTCFKTRVSEHVF